MTWRLARSLEVLRNQINVAYPARDKSSDGTIGDTAHAASKSDHNPNSDGVVTAIDITHDPAHGLDARKLAEALVASRDKRIKYIISNALIVSSLVSPWRWRPYSGANAHRKHVHVSVTAERALYDSTEPWAIGGKAAVARPPLLAGNTARRFTNITATVFGGPTDVNASAYGGMVNPSKPGVALPFRFTGTRPKVRVFNGGMMVDCEIVDVGPWNINDPYWTTTDGRPLAERLYKARAPDFKGRIPTNDAGIDLTPAAANAIGIAGKGIVDWEFVGAVPATKPPGKPATETGGAAVVIGGGAVAAQQAGVSPWIIAVGVAVAMLGVGGFLAWRFRDAIKQWWDEL